jgi:ATP-binding cassette, subfamily B, multidrug efflux pump
LPNPEAPPLRRLLGYVSRAPGSYVLGGLLTIGYAAVFQLVPLATGRVIERIHDGASTAEVMRAVWTLVAVGTCVAAMRLFSRIVVFSAARQIEYEIRNDLLQKLQTLSQSYFATHRTGDLMSRAVNDLNSIRLFLGMGLLNIVQTPVLYAGAFSVMVASDWVLTLSVIVPYALFVGAMQGLARNVQPSSLAVQEQLGDLSAVVQENASGVYVVRTYAMENQESQRFARASRELYRRQLRFARYQLALQPLFGLLPALGLVVLLLVGGSRVRSGALTLGEFAAFNSYLAMLTFPSLMLGFVVVITQRGLASLRRIGEVLDEVPTIRGGSSATGQARIAGAVSFREFSFAYRPGAAPALDRVSLDVEAGQTIGVVGAVGSGKTTLVSAIPRLIEIPPGRVLIDGRDGGELALGLLRSSIAMVPQDSFLFSASVAENIAFGLPSMDRDRVREAARRAHVLDDIEDLPHGFDTEVGERGITLSGGQRQRIALARALILEPSILILDDSLSSVDAVTEEAILKELRGARAGRTCFIVAHRLSAVRDADRIVVLEAGRVIETGAHEALLRLGGTYAQLYRRQQLEAELGGGLS